MGRVRGCVKGRDRGRRRRNMTSVGNESDPKERVSSRDAAKRWSEACTRDSMYELVQACRERCLSLVSTTSTLIIHAHYNMHIPAHACSSVCIVFECIATTSFESTTCKGHTATMRIVCAVLVAFMSCMWIDWVATCADSCRSAVMLHLSCMCAC